MLIPTEIVGLLLLALCAEMCSASSPSSPYPVQSSRCPVGWAHYSKTDECLLYVGPSKQLRREPLLYDYPFRTFTPYKTSHSEAANRCHIDFDEATLVDVISLNHTAFVLGLIPRGTAVWMAPYYHPKSRRWVVGRGRPPRSLPWDTPNGEPRIPHGACAALHRSGTSLTSGGGNDLLLSEECGVPLAYVCSRPRVPPRILAVNGAVGPQGLRAVFTRGLVLSFAGVNLRDNVYVSIQTARDGRDGPLPSGSAVPCENVRSLEGIAAPRLLSLSARASLRPMSFCNGTCALANITLSSKTPWRIGEVYSICYAVGATSRNTPAEYFRSAGGGATIEVIQERSEFLRDVCRMRSGMVDSVRHQIDDKNKAPSTKPIPGNWEK